MRTAIKPVPAALLALLMPFAAAQAAEPGFYVGGKVGAASYDDEFLDEDDTSFGLYLGWRFNEWFAIEGDYTSFGDIEGSLTPPELGRGSVEPESLGVAAVGYIPFSEQFSAFGKAGFHSWDLNPEFGEDVEDVIGEDDSTDPYYGLGVQFDFQNNLALRAQYTRFEFGDGDSDEVSVGLQYTF